MSTPSRRGKKRKLTAALDALSSSGYKDGMGSSQSGKSLEPLDLIDKKTDDLPAPASQSSKCDDYTEQESLAVETIAPIVSSGLTVLRVQAMNLVPISFLSRRIHYISNVINNSMNTMYSCEQVAELVRKVEGVIFNDVVGMVNFQTPRVEVLWNVTLATKVAHTAFLGPPTIKCLVCSKGLSIHNDPSTVILFGLHGPLPAIKITLRCDSCMINYRYVATSDQIMCAACTVK